MAEDTQTNNGERGWLTVKGSAERARTGEKVIYRAVAANQLRAARVGGRRSLRLKPQWVDEWLERSATPVEAHPSRASRRGK